MLYTECVLANRRAREMYNGGCLEIALNESTGQFPRNLALVEERHNG